MPFLSSFRRRREPERETKQQPSSEAEYKLLLADYYSTLANAGVDLHDSARPWPVERAIREGYDRVVWVFKAVTCIGENVGRDDIPFEVVEGPEDDERVVEDHPVARLLNGQANPMETGDVFLERLTAQFLLNKRGAFVEVTKSNAGTPIRYDLLPPGRTRAVPGYSSLVDHYEVTRLDGTRYTIEPERVRWIRKPHPIDPYSGVTPLESAGLSVELDYFARLYNHSFMRHDGRPSMLVGISGPEKGGGGLDPADMETLDARFGRGPAEAGKVTVVEGEISVADLAVNPRDSQYMGVSKNCKTEILVAFGTPESVLGNASDRTYENASAESYAFWSVTMLPTMSRIAAGFRADLGEGQRGRFNTSTITVLELPLREKRREAREEVAAGLRSIKSYADLAGYGDEIEDTPQTRALWIPSGSNPLPSREEDAEALGMGTPVEDEAPAAPNDAFPGVPAGEEPRQITQAGEPLSVPSERADTNVSVTPPAAAASKPEAKAAPPVATKVAAPWEDITPADTETPAADALNEALTAQTTKWMERAGSRLRSPKTRKGTRHFTPEHKVDTRVGTKALDAAHAANEDDWADDTEATTRPLLEQFALAAAAAWLTAATGETVAVNSLPGRVTKAAIAAAAAAMPALVAGAAWQARRTARAIADVDAAGGTVDEAVAAAKARAEDIATWVRNASQDAAGAAIEVGHAAAADHWLKVGPGVEIQRQWISRKDDTVRTSHEKAHGQRRQVGAPFTVGGALLRYPKDPLGPPGETRNCRCRTLFRHRKTGRFTQVTTQVVEAS